MTLSEEALNDFRMSWRECQDESFPSRMERKSLIALAAEVPELQEILTEETWED